MPGTGDFNLSMLWAEIVAVRSPGPVPALPHHKSLHVKPSPASVRLGLKRRLRIALATLVVSAGAAGWYYGVPLRGGGSFWTIIIAAVVGWWVGNASYKQREGARRAIGDARGRWDLVSRRWHDEAGDKAFHAKRAELERARETLLDLPERRNRVVRQLETQHRERQLYWFLEQHRVSAGMIAGVGLGREAVLRSYGIETAADVTYGAVIAIPGFGPRLTEKLVAWRQQLERVFVFDPTKGIDPRDIAALKRELRDTKQRMEQLLRGGAAELRRIGREALFKRQALRAQIDQALEALARAEAEWRAL